MWVVLFWIAIDRKTQAVTRTVLLSTLLNLHVDVTPFEKYLT